MHKQTIALVDDDRNILTSLSIALEKEGFKVQTYIDGESALIGLTRTPPDLAIIDIKLDKGESEEQIYSYFKEKYGAWIIYDPEFNVKTLLLWLIPLILFAIGGILIFRKLTISKFL